MKKTTKTIPWIKKHQIALDELYTKNGVGKTVKQKFSFWESRHPDGYSISHNPTMKIKVVLFENCYLVDLFPGDFYIC